MLLEGTPAGTDMPGVIGAIKGVPGVLDVHDLHVWMVGPGVVACSCHIIVAEQSVREGQQVLRAVVDDLKRRFHITHTTVQVEVEGCEDNDMYCVAERAVDAARRTARTGTTTVASQGISLRAVSTSQRVDLLVIRLVARVVEHLAVADDPVLVQHEHGPLGDPLQADHVVVEDAVLADDLLVEVAQQRKRQSLLIRERLERKEGIDADAVHLGPCLVELAERVAEGAQLFLAHRTERRREKRQDDRPASAG